MLKYTVNDCGKTELIDKHSGNHLSARKAVAMPQVHACEELAHVLDNLLLEMVNTNE